MALREIAEVDIGRNTEALAEAQSRTRCRVGHWEANGRLKASCKRLVAIIMLVGRQDRKPRITLQPLQQIGDLLVCGTVVRRARIGALAEQCIRFVGEQDPVTVLRLIELARLLPEISMASPGTTTCSNRILGSVRTRADRCTVSASFGESHAIRQLATRQISRQRRSSFRSIPATRPPSRTIALSSRPSMHSSRRASKPTARERL